MISEFIVPPHVPNYPKVNQVLGGGWLKRKVEDAIAATKAKAKAEEAARCHAIELANPEAVREYVEDLKKLLEESSIVEQKAFLKSFVEKIEVDSSEMKVVYSIPMPPDSPPAETVAVLPFIHNGPPLRMEGDGKEHVLGTE